MMTKLLLLLLLINKTTSTANSSENEERAPAHQALGERLKSNMLRVLQVSGT